MLIMLNGERYEVADNSTLSDLLTTLEMQNGRFAVEVNEELIPRSEHATHPLKSSDRVEIVQAIGGG
jgi:sulfur carrier protein